MPRPVGGDECSESKTDKQSLQRRDCPAPHFRRGWKASAIREASPCRRRPSLHNLDLEEQISSIAITIHLTQTPQTQTGSFLNARGDRYQESPLF